MRIAVLADIHGNLRALEAVQRDLRNQSPDIVLNLGDHLSGPLQAAATADALTNEPYLNIRGNHDRQLVDRPSEAMGPSDLAAHSQLTGRHRQWLTGLPATYRLDPGILLCHGTPQNDLEYLLEDVQPDGVRLATSVQIAQKLGPTQATLVLCGHTHIPRLVTLANGIQIVNPGSVGLPAYDDATPCRHYMETGSPHARFAVIDRAGTSWKVTLVAVEYDWYAASEDARLNNRPDWAHALATGFALRS